MIKRWGKVWYAIRIAGTVILIGLWVITRIADNPITGRGGPISERAIAVEVFQIAYVAITALIMQKKELESHHQLKRRDNFELIKGYRKLVNEPGVSPSSRIVFLFTTHRGESVVKGTNYLERELNAIQMEYNSASFMNTGKSEDYFLIYYYY